MVAYVVVGVHPQTKLPKTFFWVHSEELVARPGPRILDGAVVGEIQGMDVHT